MSLTYGSLAHDLMFQNGFGLTPLFGDRRGFMPPQLKTKQKLD